MFLLISNLKYHQILFILIVIIVIAINPSSKPIYSKHSMLQATQSIVIWVYNFFWPWIYNTIINDKPKQPQNYSREWVGEPDYIKPNLCPIKKSKLKGKGKGGWLVGGKDGKQPDFGN